MLWSQGRGYCLEPCPHQVSNLALWDSLGPKRPHPSIGHPHPCEVPKRGWGGTETREGSQPVQKGAPRLALSWPARKAAEEWRGSAPVPRGTGPLLGS